MTNRNKTIIVILIPILLFAISATLYYITVLKCENSYIQLDRVNSKIELQKGEYIIHSVSRENDIEKKIDVEAKENKTHDTLNIVVSKISPTTLICTSQTTILNGKRYDYLRSVKISKKGLYIISIHDPKQIKANLVLQNQNLDSSLFKSILVYYLSSLFSITLLVIVLLFFFLKNKRLKTQNLSKSKP